MYFFVYDILSTLNKEKINKINQLKERETFWQHRLKTFYTIGLNEKEEYLY